MHWLQHLADGLTLGRVILSFGIVGVGLAQRAQGVGTAASLLLLAWTTDLLDGPLARRSGAQEESWLGARDLYVDVILGVAVLVFLCLADLVHWGMAALYVCVWALVFWRQGGLPKALGALFQGPVYGWFVLQAIQRTHQIGWTLVLWVAATVGLTWKRFRGRRVPAFLRGLDRHVLRRIQRRR